MFARSDLALFTGAKPSPGVSCYLSIHKHGVEIRQNSMRLRYVVATVRQSLEWPGQNRVEIDAVFDPTAILGKGNSFRQRQPLDLVLSLGGGQTHNFSVPIQFDPKVAIDRAFQISPLPAAAGSFQALTTTGTKSRVSGESPEDWRAANKVELARRVAIGDGASPHSALPRNAPTADRASHRRRMRRVFA